MALDRRWIQAEEALHAEALGWLNANREFRLVFEDPDEATGARLDLIAVLDGQPCFAEIKVSCLLSTVPSLERKFSSALHGHSTLAERHPMLGAMRSVWDGTEVPLLAVIARSYPEKGLHALKVMLAQRSADWQVDAEVWQWTGSALHLLFRCHRETRTRSHGLKIDVPPADKQNRRPNATEADLIAIASANGISELFRIALADAVGLKRDFRTDSVTLTHRQGNKWLRLLPGKSNRKVGLVMDCVDEIHARLAGLPITDLGRGIYTYSRIATPDPETVRRVIRVAVDEAGSAVRDSLSTRTA